MRALTLVLTLLVPCAALADDECLKSCDEVAKICTESCSKKSKGNAACKPQCTKVGDECKKDCKEQSLPPAKEGEK